MMDLAVGWRYYDQEEEVYKKQMKEGMPRKSSSEFFNQCKDLGIESILDNKDKWISSFFTKEVFQEVVDKVNLLNNIKYKEDVTTE